MRISEVLQIIESLKGGQFHNIAWEKTLKTRKGITDTVTKKSSAIVRLGVSYDNKQAVIDKRENGELPSENQGLPYGKWEIFPYLIAHNGSFQLRVTTAKNTKVETQYFLNGEKVHKSEIAELVLKSEIPQPNSTPIDVFNLKIENIVSIV